MSEWIDKPPTAGEVGDGDLAMVTANDGEVYAWAGASIRQSWSSTLAWQKRPDPYVPPKPERREQWVHGLQVYDHEPTWDGIASARSYRIREVLPGDPTPEAIADAVDVLEEMASGRLTVFMSHLQGIANKLRPKADQ